MLAAVPGLAHGFTLRAAGDFSAGPPPDWPAAAGACRLRLLRQVHGAAVAGARDPRPEPEADAWAGRPPPGTLLGIRTADCLAVLLCHPPSGTVGLAHAGWRGAAAGVVDRTVSAMGCPPRELVAALGPAIGPCCYPVGPEVAGALGRGPHVTRDRGGRFRVDLAGYVENRLLDLGAPADRIERVGGCTACDPDRYFSHRARQDRGRLCAFIGWTAP